MGVLTCSRGNCINIMCDKHSYDYGYICDDCFEELVFTNLSIADFMKTDIGDVHIINRRKELEEIFVNRKEW